MGEGALTTEVVGASPIVTPVVLRRSSRLPPEGAALTTVEEVVEAVEPLRNEQLQVGVVYFTSGTNGPSVLGPKA